MKKIIAYLTLMRFHKPVGILLLWAPTAWALWLANHGMPSVKLLLLFFLGTVLMRAAGCVVNDIADRKIDLHVTRTKNRPLTAGVITLSEALVLLITLLFAALVVLIQLPSACFYYALAALAITIIYPFCKRFLQGPQLILGLAFSMGIPMAYAASNAPLNATVIYLLLINFAWIVAYDTEYAMVDRSDDLKIGVRSTAIWFASYDRLIIGLLQVVHHSLWLLLAYQHDLSPIFYYCWVVAGGNLVYQQYLLVERNESKCLNAFTMNTWYGLVMWVGLMLS